MFRCGSSLMVLTLLAWSPAYAEQPAEKPAAEPDVLTRISKLSVHGYLTQAYAISDEHQFIGIPTDGTLDYRTAALQIRYNISPRHLLIFQFSHERLGDSPYAETRDELEVDWLFYQQNFSGETSVKLGRVPIPAGIYNEIRDVGTILPFYRPPSVIYLERMFISETLDGMVLSRTFLPRSAWSLETDLYYGEWESVTETVRPADIDHAVGTQLWLNTPIDGLRFGLGGRHYDVSRPDRRRENTFDQWIVSVDADFARVVVRGEYDRVRFFEAERIAYYGQIGVRATEKWSIFFQAEHSEHDFTMSSVGPLKLDTNEDFAVGLAYAVLPDVVWKLETHWNEGYEAEDLPPDAPYVSEPFDARYAILSLSASF